MSHISQSSGVPRGEKKYKLTFHDKSSPDTTASGRQLMENGLGMTLPVANSSELVFIEQTD